MYQNTGSYQEMMEAKFEGAEERRAQPASPYMLRQLQEKLMRKFSTTYQAPKRKAA